ncbi:hypothetical protein Cni_G04528 [Canna indica]|uniref:Cell division control protein 24 OB domain-containing protein n=1 Tax=Canna indica TaxID=4628 RepID=A0AAQ3JTR0_9LILI|nr:hypothetical protein Cni_G04528 [Canna indica]
MRLPNTVTIDSVYEKNFLSPNSVVEAVVVDVTFFQMRRYNLLVTFHCYVSLLYQRKKLDASDLLYEDIFNKGKKDYFIASREWNELCVYHPFFVLLIHCSQTTEGEVSCGKVSLGSLMSHPCALSASG